MILAEFAKPRNPIIKHQTHSANICLHSFATNALHIPYNSLGGPHQPAEKPPPPPLSGPPTSEIAPRTSDLGPRP